MGKQRTSFEGVKRPIPFLDMARLNTLLQLLVKAGKVSKAGGSGPIRSITG
jgi:hypothetical protein